MEKLYTVAEVAEMFRCKKTTVYDWVHFGRIGCSKLGGLRFTLGNIEEFVRQNTKHAKRRTPRTPGTRNRSCRVPADTLALIEVARAEVLQFGGGSCAERKVS